MTRTHFHRTRLWRAALLLIACLATGGAIASETQPLVLEAGQEGKAFDALTVEGEDRVRVNFQRPELTLSLDPMQVAGLQGGSIRDLLLGSELDLISTFLATSAGRGRSYRPLAWFDEFATGTLVRFRPALEGVADWSLTIADSRGDTTAVFSGRGEPPEEIGWDGRRRDGEFAQPGLVYSHVLSARDRAGNLRNFVGEGFSLPPYRLEEEGGFTLLMTGADLQPTTRYGTRQTAPLLLGAAHRINQASPTWPLRLVVAARSYDQARDLAERAAATLRPHLLGDPLRLQIFTEVDPRAPAEGGLRIACLPTTDSG